MANKVKNLKIMLEYCIYFSWIKFKIRPSHFKMAPCCDELSLPIAFLCQNCQFNIW
mgnify:CR=1 FL=1|jgi:hypothetical protein